MLAWAIFATTAFAGTELTVYTAFEAEDLQRYKDTFNKDHPDIKINWVRDSTGIITAKLLAEKNNPQADVIPNPNSSGTGFLDVSSWLQMFGEYGGWQYMDSLHKNIARYTHSGSRPCKLAAAGEIPIGISFAFRGAKSKAAGAPIEIIIPKEGVGWEMEAGGIVAGTSKLEAAKTLMDWAVSPKAMKMYG